MGECMCVVVVGVVVVGVGDAVVGWVVGVVCKDMCCQNHSNSDVTIHTLDTQTHLKQTLKHFNTHHETHTGSVVHEVV